MKQYKNIVIGVDLAEPLEPLLAQAKLFANHQHSHFHLVHVYPALSMTVPYATEYEGQLVRDLKVKLEELTQHFAGLAMTTHLVQGNASIELVKLASSLEANLIVVGSHGKHGVELLLGSTANGVLYGCSCDILAVRINKQGIHDGRDHYKTVLLATDFSSESEKIIHLAKQFCDDIKAQLHVISVVPDPAVLASMYQPGVDDDSLPSVEKKMAHLISTLSISKSNTRLIAGEPKFEILTYANEIDTNLIVVGSHGKNILASAVLGSTPHALLHKAKMDVFLSRI